MKSYGYGVLIEKDDVIEESNKDPENCPFCQAEERGESSGWSGWSGCREFFKMMREKHNKEHN